MAIGIPPAGDSEESPCVFGALSGVGGIHHDAAGAPVGGGKVLEDVREGRKVDWANSHVTPGHADCILAALGLLHMRVKCVIFEVGGIIMWR